MKQLLVFMMLGMITPAVAKIADASPSGCNEDLTNIVDVAKLNLL